MARAPGELPPAVLQLIRRHLHSVLDVETLLLLRSQPETAWSASVLRIALYITEEAAAEHLAKLHAGGLLAATHDGEHATLYRYAPSAATARAVDELAVVYAQRKVRVIEVIYSGPLDSVRSFASAFRLRSPRRK